MNCFKYMPVALPLLILGLLALHVDTSAESDGTNLPVFEVVDTRQGAIRYNTLTGESWILRDSSKLYWEAIPVSASDSVKAKKASIDDVEWTVIMREDGTVVGLSITEKLREDVFEQLLIGDVVTKLNGESVDSVGRLRALYRQAVNDEDRQLEFTVIRDGQEKTVEVQVR